MHKTILIVLVGILVAIAVWFANGYNKLVVEEENVEEAWGEVETAYQHRYDLITQAATVVKKYSEYESKTLLDVVQARQQVATVDPSKLTEEEMKNYEEQLSADNASFKQACHQLLAIAEAYPDLKASQEYERLMTQLEGTENRIRAARNAYNKVAQELNVLVRRFPGNIVASFFGFEKKPYFKSDEGASKAVNVGDIL